MHKLFLISVLILSSMVVARSQDGWTTIKIEGFGGIDLPPNMEVQGGAYREMSDKMKEINGISASKVIFQQKNLNSGSQSSLNTYARVFIRTEFGTAGEFQKLSNFSLNPSDLKEMNDEYKTEIYNSAASGNASVLEWYPATLSSLNGYKSVTLGYKRKLGANPPVMVRFYFFHNYNRIHVLTFEYRIADEITWQPTFEKIKKSLTINSQ